jgi:hypothetical protein
MSFSAISMIYTTIVNAFLESFNAEIKECIPGIIEAQLDVYD